MQAPHAGAVHVDQEAAQEEFRVADGRREGQQLGCRCRSCLLGTQKEGGSKVSIVVQQTEGINAEQRTAAPCSPCRRWTTPELASRGPAPAATCPPGVHAQVVVWAQHPRHPLVVHDCQAHAHVHEACTQPSYKEIRVVQTNMRKGPIVTPQAHAHVHKACTHVEHLERFSAAAQALGG